MLNYYLTKMMISTRRRKRTMTMQTGATIQSSRRLAWSKTALSGRASVVARACENLEDVHF